MPFEGNKAEGDQVQLSLIESGLVIDRWIEYSFESNLLTPSDGWTMTVAAARISPELRAGLIPGAGVRLSINGAVQATGYIDSIEVDASKDSGTEIKLEGRDRLAQAIDACADPTKSFKQGQTLEQMLIELFTPFGFTKPDHFVADAAASRDVKLGKLTGEHLTHPSRGGGGRKRRRSSRSRRGGGPREVASWKLHQLRPHVREGVFEFASRVSDRFGLKIWLDPTGEQMIVGRPDFDQDPYYDLVRLESPTEDARTNVISGSVKIDASDQPTVFLADGYSGGGEWGIGRIKAIAVNRAVKPPGDPLEPVQKYIKAGAKVIETPAFDNPMPVPRHRPVFLHDDESQTLEHLEFFLQRELALVQRKSLHANYVVEGHGQLTAEGFHMWTVDTTVDVEDEPARLKEILYVLGRTFMKSRGGGTTTRLELIRKNTLVFGGDK